MSRESSVYMLIGLMMVSTVWLYWLRRQIVGRAFQAIYSDLRERNIQLSEYEKQLLRGQLRWNQNAVFESEPHADLRAVKEQHVRSMTRFLAVIRTCLWILLAIILGALLLLIEY